MSEWLANELQGLALFLFRDGLLDFPTAKLAVTVAKQQGMSLTQHLVTANILSSQAIFDYCATQFNWPLFDMKNYDAHLLKDNPIPADLMLRYRVLPLYKDKRGLWVGITDPTEQRSLAAISFSTKLEVKPILIAENDLEKLLQMHLQQPLRYADVEMALAKIDAPKEEVAFEKYNDEPIINLVNQLIQDAVQKQISDIHIEPFENYCRIRFRRDGLLYEATTLPSAIATQVVSRLKILANLNIAEKRLAQDGRFQFLQQHKIDIRINTCPTLFGEKMVLRLLDSQKIKLAIEQLGFSAQELAIFLEKLTDPQGLILVTGPTGSGKTTTLYAALEYLNHVSKNIISIEDPVEIELQGINQINVNPKVGLDFPSALRTLLRQDPDIIMVGEIRDAETAEIATQAALTGHLVLSTLHTNSAIETLMRLQSMISKFSFINATSLIIAQRLIRKLCPHCKCLATTPAENIINHYLNHKDGCDDCHHGYQGRASLFEFLPLTETLIELILTDAPQSSIMQRALSEGSTSLWDAGIKFVEQGMTSVAELNRVLTKKHKRC